MIRRGISLLFIFSVSFGTVEAQSPLSLEYPLGIPLRNGTGPSLSLAGTGIGIGNDLFGFAANPANLGISQRTTFSTAVSGNVLNIDDRELSSRHFDMNLHIFSLSIPLGNYGVIGVAVEPQSSADLLWRISDVNEHTASSDDSLLVGIRGSGGTVAWQAGWGYTVRRLFRIGISYKRLNFNRTLSIIRQSYGSGPIDQQIDSMRTTFASNGFRGGFQIPVHKLTIGLSGEYFFMARAASTHVITGTLDTLDLVNKRESFDLKPPPSIGLGLSYEFNPSWLAALDGGATMWSRYHSDFESSGFRPDDAWFVSCGVRYIPAPNLLTPKFYEIIQYRAGLRYSQLPGSQASELALTLSTGLPLQSYGGLFDIIFEYGQRRDRRFDHYKEHSFGLKLGINGGRKWYQSKDDSY